MDKTDYLIIGGGIIGLTLAYSLNKKYPSKTILIIDKESDVAKHASGRNSGVLHAGLYYAHDGLRAKYCVAGAKLMTEYSLSKNIRLNQCGKVVVANGENEVEQIKELYELGLTNGVQVQLIDELELSEIEPCAKTTQLAIYSPNTASFHHLGICNSLKADLLATKQVAFKFNTQFMAVVDRHTAKTNNGIIEYDMLINCAGMYADKIAKHFGLIENYTLIPFKGVFLYCDDLVGNYSKHIYPVPDKKLKLLGVHFSPEYDGKIKIGPTAVPCLSRENYSWLSNLRYTEMKEIVLAESKLFINNRFNFRDLAITELKKQTKCGLIKYASTLVKDINQFKFSNWGVPGIQARLYDLKNQEIMDDFLVLRVDNSVHVVNSVSPAFTASFAFSQYIIDKYIN